MNTLKLLALFLIGWAVADIASRHSDGITIEQFTRYMDECKSQGGNPKPIYDHDDPIVVYRIDCIKKA